MMISAHRTGPGGGAHGTPGMTFGPCPPVRLSACAPVPVQGRVATGQPTGAVNRATMRSAAASSGYVSGVRT